MLIIEETKQKILSWIEKNQDDNLFLFCYSLGKAQKIQYLLQEKLNKQIFVHKSIKKINNIYNDFLDFNFMVDEIDEAEPNQGNLFLFPQHISNSNKIIELIKKYNAKKAAFSGWAINNSFKYKGNFDKTFILSDHADFNGLVEIIKKTNPKKVFTYHGFSEKFAKFLEKNLNIEARALKKNQTHLSYF